MREYLTRAGIIGTANGRNDTFGESTRERRQNEPIGDNFNSTLTVRI